MPFPIPTYGVMNFAKARLKDSRTVFVPSYWWSKIIISKIAPITHTEPLNPDAALEIPPKVKAHLGLDAERLWIILDDFNEFIWPGYDLRSVSGKPGCFDYGFLPPLFLKQIITKILDLRSKTKRITPRD